MQFILFILGFLLGELIMKLTKNDNPIGTIVISNENGKYEMYMALKDENTMKLPNGTYCIKLKHVSQK